MASSYTSASKENGLFTPLGDGGTFTREYWNACISRDPNNYPTLKDLPHSIAPNKTWHNALNTLRLSAKIEGKEGIIDVGYAPEQNDILIQTVPLFGSQTGITEAQRDKQVALARSAGVELVTARIHDHFDNFFEPFKRWFFGLLYASGRDSWSATRFSISDLLDFLKPQPEYSLAGLVTQDANIFAVRTQETFSAFQAHNQAHFYEQLDDLKRIWFCTYGQSWNGNKRIAEVYRFGLYKGNPNSHLYRVYPK